jgi:hypothetical protein
MPDFAVVETEPQSAAVEAWGSFEQPDPRMC